MKPSSSIIAAHGTLSSLSQHFTLQSFATDGYTDLSVAPGSESFVQDFVKSKADDI